ncbi:MAG: hypothetical protein ABGX16_12190 [Pirellulales bacterium]
MNAKFGNIRYVVKTRHDLTVMRDNNQRCSMFGGVLLKCVQDASRVVGIQIGRRLVCKQYVGIGDDGPADRDPLTFALRELVWPSGKYFPETDSFRELMST